MTSVSGDCVRANMIVCARELLCARARIFVCAIGKFVRAYHESFETIYAPYSRCAVVHDPVCAKQ